MPDRREERALLRQRPAVRHHRKRVHLQAVVVVETQRLMRQHPAVQRELALGRHLLQPLPRPRVAGIQDRQIILLRHLINRGKE